MRRVEIVTIALVAIVVTSVLAVGVVEARARGKPDLSVRFVDEEVAPGQDVDLELVVQNAGEVAYASSAAEQSRVTTARAVSVTAKSGNAPVEVQTGTRAIGNVPEGVSDPVSIDVSVDPDAEPGEYELNVEIEYTYTSVIGREGEHNERTRVQTFDATLVVEDGPSFDVVTASADDFYGTSGPVELTIENTGTGTASNAEVVVESGSGQLTFGGSATASTFVGDWAPGETRVVTFEGSLAEGAGSRNYPLSATVNYEDDDGEDAESATLSTGVTPRAESRFGLQDVESTLAVGEEGTVTGTIVNQGGSAARNVVVVLSGDTRNVEPVETEYSVGDLEPGGSASFSFDVEVGESAAGGPRQLDFSVRHRDRNNEVVESDQLEARVDVGPNRDTFEVTPVNNSVEPGSASTLELRVTNQADETLTDISGKLFTDDPLGSDDDEAFIDSLAPGASETVVFDVSAGASAMEKTYPASVDFQYDDADGDTHVSDTYRVPVRVQSTQSEDDGGPSLLLLGAVVAVLVAAGVYGYRRYRG